MKPNTIIIVVLLGVLGFLILKSTSSTKLDASGSSVPSGTGGVQTAGPKSLFDQIADAVNRVVDTAQRIVAPAPKQ